MKFPDGKRNRTLSHARVRWLRKEIEKRRKRGEQWKTIAAAVGVNIYTLQDVHKRRTYREVE